MNAGLLVLALAASAATAPVRPQLDAADAARHTVAAYLAQGPAPWQPAPLHGQPTSPAQAIVAADGSGTHTTVQAAVDAAPALASVSGRGGARHVIHIRPGVYRERLCIRGKGPLTLVGDAADAAAVRIVGSAYNALPKRPGVDAAHPCHPDLAAATHGTPGSATVVVASEDFQALHLTIENDALAAVRDGVGYPTGAGESGGAQAVALTVQADRVQLEGVRLLGHQDTLFVRRPARDEPARVYVHGSLIAGDVDFIFGDGTLVIHRSTVLSRAGRRTPGEGGHVLAPSTPAGVAHGFLVIDSRFAADPGLAPGSHSLGRAWDAGVPRGGWQPGLMNGNPPNGQALVRDSALGPHLAPWAASTSRRPFAASGQATNRLAEFDNHDETQDPARQALAPNDGWAAADGGTRGGADALPSDVHTVRTRAELAAALRPHGRPRIVQVAGRIDLSTDDAGRPLGADDYRDPAFDWPAFERAYDPATWGRRKPEGPLERARQASARRQAAQVVLRVPSRSTLIGLGADAQLTGGMLLLEKVRDVIVRNLRLSDAHDHFPAWDPGDNAAGEWNAEYDNLSLRGASRVWVDHCSFDDGGRPDEGARSALGRRLQHHDGLLDITQQSDRVTVSWNHFQRHDKTSLVGSSDGATADEGRLRVTFHHNHWDRVKERAPRVRYGQVHLVNNLHTVDGEPGAHGYSIGVGYRSRIVSEHNVWEGPATLQPTQLLRLLKGQAFTDRGSQLNGRPVDLLSALRAAHPGAALSADVGWTPPFGPGAEPAEGLAQRVRAGAGAGRLPMSAAPRRPLDPSR